MEKKVLYDSSQIKIDLYPGNSKWYVLKIGRNEYSFSELEYFTKYNNLKEFKKKISNHQPGVIRSLTENKISIDELVLAFERANIKDSSSRKKD